MLVAIINFLQAWRRYNNSLRELYQLGDRELADIGISRSDIPRVAWDAANPLIPRNEQGKRPPRAGVFFAGFPSPGTGPNGPATIVVPCRQS